MITIKNGTIVGCDSAFGLVGNVSLNIDGLYVDSCGTVYDIDSESANINAHAKNVNVTNTGTFIKIGGSPTGASTGSKSFETSSAISPLVFPNDNYAMRIALQYIDATSRR